LRSLRFLRVVLLAGALAIPTLAVGSGSVLAYGKADQPLAQVEVSANCNNPSYPLCANVVGTGGIWVWIEVDANGMADVAGAACEHTVGGPRGGAFPIRAEVPWTYASGSDFPPQAVFAVDPSDSYYAIPAVLDFPIPVTPGHYSFRPAPGVSLQIQVAP
jgi:hypothetical protein